MAIPKIIHYVWVGDGEKPELVERCIASWRRYAPDYQLVEWNNEKFHQTDNLYARQAFAAKKWAFVSDYLRLYALATQGGFYPGYRPGTDRRSGVIPSTPVCHGL